MNNHKTKLMSYLFALLIIAAAVGSVLYLKSSGILNHMYSVEAFKKYIRGFEGKAYTVFFLIQFLASVVAPIPNNVTAVAGAAVLGMWEAFFISFSATLIGSVVAFILAKKVGKPITDKLVSRKVASKYKKLLEKKGSKLLILMFLLPFFPDDALCFLAGLSKISFNKFIVIMVLARPWGILGSALVGAGSLSFPWWGWILIVTGSIVIMRYSDKIEEKLVNLFKYIKVKESKINNE